MDDLASGDKGTLAPSVPTRGDNTCETLAPGVPARGDNSCELLAPGVRTRGDNTCETLAPGVPARGGDNNCMELPGVPPDLGLLKGEGRSEGAFVKSCPAVKEGSCMMV